MIKKLSELKPYKSLLLARVQSSIPVKDIVDNLLEDLSELLSLGEDGPRTLISEVNEINAGELVVGYLHYSEETPTPWTKLTTLRPLDALLTLTKGSLLSVRRHEGQEFGLARAAPGMNS